MYTTIYCARTLIVCLSNTLSPQNIRRYLYTRFDSMRRWSRILNGSCLNKPDVKVSFRGKSLEGEKYSTVPLGLIWPLGYFKASSKHWPFWKRPSEFRLLGSLEHVQLLESRQWKLFQYCSHPTSVSNHLVTNILHVATTSR